MVASYLDFDDRATGSAAGHGQLRFTVGMGERGVPLSPDTLVLPTAVRGRAPPGQPRRRRGHARAGPGLERRQRARRERCRKRRASARTGRS